MFNLCLQYFNPASCLYFRADPDTNRPRGWVLQLRKCLLLLCSGNFVDSKNSKILLRRRNSVVFCYRLVFRATVGVAQWWCFLLSLFVHADDKWSRSVHAVQVKNSIRSYFRNDSNICEKHIFSTKILQNLQKYLWNDWTRRWCDRYCNICIPF